MSARNISINLLGEEDLSHTPQGRIVQWALTYGRYIMIGTEIVVLLAFISRFSLDRKLTDLKEEIGQKQAIIEANISFEQDIKNLQEQLKNIKTLLGGQSKTLDLITFIQATLPPDIRLLSYGYSKDKLSLSTVAGTTEGFTQFIANLQSTKLLSKIEIGNIKKNAVEGMTFELTATVAQK